MAEIYLSDPDLTIWHGDAQEALQQMPDESVDCIVTSPPYLGLRDYEVEKQLGLESTPNLYVDALVEVFHEARRVLAPHGTAWINLGDSFNDKQLIGVPWRVAFALQEEGWRLRSEIIWHKPAPMPESITDRPTKAHEQIFLLTKESRYYYDSHAIREPHTSTRWGGPRIKQPPTTKYAEATAKGFAGAAEALSRPGREWNAYPEGGRNARTVWTINTKPLPDAHFAAFPMEIPRRAISAGCPSQVCTECGQPRTRIVEREVAPPEIREKDKTTLSPTEAQDFRIHNFSGQRYQDWLEEHPPETIGWTDCGHESYRTGVVLDPFFGSGTTALAARALSRNAVGIELNEEYCALAARRLQQLSLLSDVAET